MIYTYYFSIKGENTTIKTTATSKEKAMESISNYLLCPLSCLISQGSEPFTPFKVQRIKSDYYGNPRYIVHFLDFLNENEKESSTINELKYLADKRAKDMGFSKYRAKDMSGFYIKQWYSNAYELCEMIMNKRGEPYETQFKD